MASGSRFTRAVAPVKSLAGALAYLTWQSRHIRHRMPGSASMSLPAAASKNLRASSSLSARGAAYGSRTTLPRLALASMILCACAASDSAICA